MPITFGASGKPSQITVNFDARLATSLANYVPTLQDNISSSNPLFYELKKSALWQSRDGSAYLAEDLMYELGTFDSYSGYDELSDVPTDGITQVQFEWRQGAVPITYSELERKQNKTRVIDLIKSKITQAEMGFIEGFNKALLQGALSQSATNNNYDPYVSVLNGSNFIDPLGRLVSYDVTTSRSIGNIDQSTNTWWRNHRKVSAATTYLGLLLEFDNMYNLASRGPGGAPKLIITDQTTFELLNAAYYEKYRVMARTDGNYPFDNIKFRNATVVWDQYVPDVANNLANTDTKGTAWFLNPKFFKVCYESETNFEMTKFQKPPKGDSRIAHILWMGQTTINNRRKHGIIGNIARTLT